jgi:hypothetical protein
MLSDLEKIEQYLGLPAGSLNAVLWKKRKNPVVIERLEREGILLDEGLRMRRSCRQKWWELREKAGVINEQK